MVCLEGDGEWAVISDLAIEEEISGVQCVDSATHFFPLKGFLVNLLPISKPWLRATDKGQFCFHQTQTR